MGEGFYGRGGDMTIMLQDVTMMVTEVVVLTSWMSNVKNMVMIVAMLTVRDNVMIVS